MTSSHPRASKSAYGAFSNEMAARKEDVHALLTIYVNLCISEMKSVLLNVISWRAFACVKDLFQVKTSHKCANKWPLLLAIHHHDINVKIIFWRMQSWWHKISIHVILWRAHCSLQFIVIFEDFEHFMGKVMILFTV